MDDLSNARLEALVTAIREYLVRYPRALDSVRGVREWWLPPALTDCPLADVEQALERLVAAGEMVARPMANGMSLYARAAPPPRDRA